MIGISISIKSCRRSGVALDAMMRRIVDGTGGKVVRAIFADDMPAVRTTWPARVGATCPAVAAGASGLGNINGRPAMLFSAGTGGPAASGYVFNPSMAEYWCVSRWDTTLPFVNYVGMIGGQDPGPNLRGSSGTSNLHPSNTITRDGSATRAVDASAHVWRCYGAPSGTATRQVGGSDSTGIGNWIGAIGCAIACDQLLTAGEATTLLSELRTYYGI